MLMFTFIDIFKITKLISSRRFRDGTNVQKKIQLYQPYCPYVSGEQDGEKLIQFIEREMREYLEGSITSLQCVVLNNIV